MKKLIALFLVATIMSCSSEDLRDQNVAVSAKESESILDGKVLSFKNEESFVKEYSDLATLKRDELQNWISSKKVVSLLNVSDDSKDMEDDVISDSRVIYSDALKSILNTDSKVKIAGKVLWLNGRSFYLLTENESNKSSQELLSLKDNLEVYGQLLSVSGSSKSLTSRMVIPNENRIKTFISPEMNVGGSRLRHYVDLYNETIVLNDIVQTSNMFLRSILQYRSCSTFRCTWKEAMNVRNLSSDFHGLSGDTSGIWNLMGIYTNSGVSGTQTYQIAYWRFRAPYLSDANFVISGPINCSISGSNPVAVFSIELSWY